MKRFATIWAAILPWVVASVLTARAADTGGAAFVLSSPAFAAGAAIPQRFTCEGSDIAPPLAWSGAPAGTKSFALIVDDPDAPDPAAPERTWVHWVLYDISSTAHSLDEAVKGAGLPPGTREGLNDWGHTGYGGPCPPIGRHRYFHKLYAVDTVLGDLGHPTKDKLEAAIKGHVLAQTQLVGTYRKAP
jgi:Raf kinase inhibitor-like YbhB/YbcL family protein